jgi:hypothetical protein
MDIQFHLAETDYVAAQAAWLMRHPWAVGLRGLYFLVALVMFPVFLGRVAIHPSDWRKTLPGLLVVSLYSIGPILALRWSWHRAFAKLSQAERHWSATVDERGLTLSAEGQHKTHPWAEFSHVFETGRVVIFKKVQGGFLFLPKSVMSIGQLAEIAQFASSVPTCKVKFALPLS